MAERTNKFRERFPHPDRPGWWYDVMWLCRGGMRIILTDGRVVDDMW